MIADQIVTDLLQLPMRTSKPRASGITMVIDGGLPTAYFEDAILSAAPLVDAVKLGWGTALATRHLDRKLAFLRDHQIRAYFGGTLFEKFVAQDRFDAFLQLCRQFEMEYIEVSNGTIELSNKAKSFFIRTCSEEFTVVSEVGFKDDERSHRLSPSQWIDYIWEDLSAGAALVTTEARESGRSGICHSDGAPRYGLVEDILGSGLPVDRLLFEAPNKELQALFVDWVGPNVNLANIGAGEVIGLETLRLGLRSDTLLETEERLRCA